MAVDVMEVARTLDNLKTCFVISPIGGKDSQVRKDADDLLELVIEPALQKFDFNVIRADRIAGSVAITADIISLVQNAALCIIDLTNQNANVYYECGRRHETGKPFIQLVRAGDALPFDVAGIRTITYDLSTPHTVRSAVKDLQRFVEAFDAEAFASPSSGGSIASVGEALDRVERKLDRLSTALKFPFSGGPQVSGQDIDLLGLQVDPSGQRVDLSGQRLSPKRAFRLALARRDKRGIAASLLRLQNDEGGMTPNVVGSAIIAAQRGVEEGAVIVFECLDEWPHDSDEAGFTRDDGLRALVSYFCETDREEEGIGRILPQLEERYGNVGDAIERASFANQIQKLYWGSGDYEKALEWINKAIQLDPEEPAYHSNASMIYEARNLLDLADKEITEALRLSGDKPTSRQLEQAVDIYWKRQKAAEATAALQRLAAIDRAAAELKVYEMEMTSR